MNRKDYIKYWLHDKPIYTLFPLKRDYAYYMWLVNKKKMNPEEAYEYTKKTQSLRYREGRGKYLYEGKRIAKLLNKKDYGYFMYLITKKKLGVKEAYEMTANTSGQSFRDKNAKRNRKYFYKGQSVREIFTEKNDISGFYKRILKDKMSVEEAVKSTMRLKKRREKIWRDYKTGKYVKSL